MKWYKEVLDLIDDNKTYCHRELVDELKSLKTDLSESTYHWAVSGLVRDKSLIRQGYDSYVISSSLRKIEYNPVYSETTEQLIDILYERFPDVRFTVFETALMNDFLNHLIAQNTVFVQVEKESSIFVFRFLQDQGFANIMYKPSKKDFNLYWSKNCIVVIDMVSEAPLRKDRPHYVMLEKMLVDMLSDKLISESYSKSEYPSVLEQVQNSYRLDKVRMLRYARRRNKQEELLKYFDTIIFVNKDSSNDSI